MVTLTLTAIHESGIYVNETDYCTFGDPNLKSILNNCNLCSRALKTTNSGNRNILVACDMYTKYMQAWPMRTQTAQETALNLYNNWLTVHGVPQRIHSDQGGNFESLQF